MLSDDSLSGLFGVGLPEVVDIYYSEGSSGYGSAMRAAGGSIDTSELRRHITQDDRLSRSLADDVSREGGAGTEYDDGMVSVEFDLDDATQGKISAVKKRVTEYLEELGYEVTAVEGRNYNVSDAKWEAIEHAVEASRDWLDDPNTGGAPPGALSSFEELEDAVASRDIRAADEAAADLYEELQDARPNVNDIVGGAARQTLYLTRGSRYYEDFE